jgi:hypothetical protein
MIYHKRNIEFFETPKLFPIKKPLNNTQKAADREVRAFVIIEKTIAAVMRTRIYIENNVYTLNV